MKKFISVVFAFTSLLLASCQIQYGSSSRMNVNPNATSGFTAPVIENSAVGLTLRSIDDKKFRLYDSLGVGFKKSNSMSFNSQIGDTNGSVLVGVAADGAVEQVMFIDEDNNPVSLEGIKVFSRLTDKYSFVALSGTAVSKIDSDATSLYTTSILKESDYLVDMSNGKMYELKDDFIKISQTVFESNGYVWDNGYISYADFYIDGHDGLVRNQIVVKGGEIYLFAYLNLNSDLNYIIEDSTITDKKIKFSKYLHIYKLEISEDDVSFKPYDVVDCYSYVEEVDTAKNYAATYYHQLLFCNKTFQNDLYWDADGDHNCGYIYDFQTKTFEPNDYADITMKYGGKEYKFGPLFNDETNRKSKQAIVYSAYAVGPDSSRYYAIFNNNSFNSISGSGASLSEVVYPRYGNDFNIIPNGLVKVGSNNEITNVIEFSEDSRNNGVAASGVIYLKNGNNVDMYYLAQSDTPKTIDVMGTSGLAKTEVNDIELKVEDGKCKIEVLTKTGGTRELTVTTQVRIVEPPRPTIDLSTPTNSYAPLNSKYALKINSQVTDLPYTTSLYRRGVNRENDCLVDLDTNAEYNLEGVYRAVAEDVIERNGYNYSDSYITNRKYYDRFTFNLEMFNSPTEIYKNEPTSGGVVKNKLVAKGDDLYLYAALKSDSISESYDLAREYMGIDIDDPKYDEYRAQALEDAFEAAFDILPTEDSFWGPAWKKDNEDDAAVVRSLVEAGFDYGTNYYLYETVEKDTQQISTEVQNIIANDCVNPMIDAGHLTQQRYIYQQDAFTQIFETGIVYSGYGLAWDGKAYVYKLNFDGSTFTPVLYDTIEGCTLFSSTFSGDLYIEDAERKGFVYNPATKEISKQNGSYVATLNSIEWTFDTGSFDKYCINEYEPLAIDSDCSKFYATQGNTIQFGDGSKNSNSVIRVDAGGKLADMYSFSTSFRSSSVVVSHALYGFERIDGDDVISVFNPLAPDEKMLHSNIQSKVWDAFGIDTSEVKKYDLSCKDGRCILTVYFTDNTYSEFQVFSNANVARYGVSDGDNVELVNLFPVAKDESE